MIKEAYIEDVILTERFIDQWDKAPQPIKKVVNKHIQSMAANHTFLPSFKPHAAQGTEDLYIGWATKTGSMWRIMFTYENDIVTLHWLGNKEAQTRYLRTI